GSTADVDTHDEAVWRHLDCAHLRTRQYLRPSPIVGQHRVDIFGERLNVLMVSLSEMNRVVLQPKLRTAAAPPAFSADKRTFAFGRREDDFNGVCRCEKQGQPKGDFNERKRVHG